MQRNRDLSRRIARCLVVALSFLALNVGISAAQGSRSASEVDLSSYHLSEAAYRQAGLVYGYLYGQHRAVEVLSQQHPDIAPALANLELQFSVRYGWPQAKAEAILLTMGEGALEKLRTKYMSETDALLSNNYTETQARTFEAELRGRVDGKIENPDVIRSLLWLRYASRPASEMIDRKTIRYTSEGNPKAKGVNFSLSVPISWRQSEADRPNTVQQWVSQNGSGDMYMSVMVKRSDDIRGLRFEDLQQLVAEGGVKDFLGENDQLIDASAVHIDGAPAIAFHAAMVRESAGTVIASQVKMYQIFDDGAAITLHCSVGRPLQEADAAQERFPLVEELCDRVAYGF